MVALKSGCLVDSIHVVVGGLVDVETLFVVACRVIDDAAEDEAVRYMAVTKTFNLMVASISRGLWGCKTAWLSG